MNARTIETYNQMAKEYDDETTDFWVRFPRTILDKFAELVRGDVLNIGSGPGRDGLLLRDRGLNITCLDASEAMVKICIEKGFKAVLGDFNALPFEEGSFEGVWAYTSLLHVPKREVAKPMSEIYRVLKSGGVFGLGLIEGELEEYRESSGVNLPRWFSFYRKEEVEGLLKEYKFEVAYFEQFKVRSKTYLNFIARK
ncbi:MAG TPA: class I SAM-dependent methyltransferase [Candidatus Paceibacterota bacterium]